MTVPKLRVPKITAQEEASQEPRALSAALPSPRAHPLLPRLPAHLSGAARAEMCTEPRRGRLHPCRKVDRNNARPTTGKERMDGQMDERMDRGSGTETSHSGHT